MAEFAGNDFSKVGINDVAWLHHLAFLHQVLDHIDRPFGHTLRQLLNGDGFRQDHFAHDLFAGFLHLAAAEFFLPAAHGSHRAAARIALVVESGGQRQLALAAFLFRLRTGRGLGRFRTNDLAANRCGRATVRTGLFLFAFRLAAGGECRRRCRRCRCRLCGLGTRLIFSLAGGNGGCFRLGSLCRFGCGLFGFAFCRGAGSFLGGEAGSFCLLGLQTLSLFGGAACLFGSAALGVFGVAELGFGKRTAAGVDLTGGKLVENHTDARTVAVVLAIVLLTWLLLRLGRARRLLLLRHGCRALRFDHACHRGSRCCDRNDRLSSSGRMGRRLRVSTTTAFVRPRPMSWRTVP